MKKIGIIIIGLMVICLGIGNAQVVSFTIHDNMDDNDNPDGSYSYWGGRVVEGKDPDVMGGSIYDFSKMVVTFDEVLKKMRVEIFADFTFSGNLGGDRYLNSKGWIVGGIGPHHEEDNFTKEEGWDYVVTYLGNQGAGIYRVDFYGIIMSNGGRVEQAFQSEDYMGKVGGGSRSGKSGSPRSLPAGRCHPTSW